jgi:hypothetical protein
MSGQRDIGTRGETAVVRFLQAEGFPQAHRRALKGALDEGDVWVDPRPLAMIEVKAGHMAEKASDGQVALWFEETERERVNSGAQVGILVVKRAGHGYDRPHLWSAYFDMTALDMMRGSNLGHRPGILARLTLASAAAQLRFYYGIEGL